MTLPMANRAAERAALKRELLGEVRDSLYHGGNVDQEVLDALDARAGLDPTTLTMDDVRLMDEESINANWDAVSAVLARGGDPTTRATPAVEAEPQQRKPTGRETAGYSADTPLTLDDVRRMSTAQVSARWGEVRRVLEGGAS